MRKSSKFLCVSMVNKTKAIYIVIINKGKDYILCPAERRLIDFDCLGWKSFALSLFLFVNHLFEAIRVFGKMWQNNITSLQAGKKLGLLARQKGQERKKWVEKINHLSGCAPKPKQSWFSWFISHHDLHDPLLSSSQLYEVCMKTLTVFMGETRKYWFPNKSFK